MDEIQSFLNKYIIGQKKLKEEVHRIIKAMKEGENFNLLFYGKPGMGKTNFLYTIEMFFIGNFQRYNYGEFFRLDERFKLHEFDEVHGVKSLERLYPYMNGKYSFLFATTELDLLPEPFISRCYLLQLEKYTIEEVAQLFRYYVTEMEDLNVEVYLKSNPRFIMKLIERFNLYSREKGKPKSDNELEEYMKDLGVYKNGITDLDLKYIEALKLNGGLAGVNLISSLSGIPKKVIEGDIEPDLIEKRIIQRTPRGRLLLKEINI